jgi:hypothetical protein
VTFVSSDQFTVKPLLVIAEDVMTGAVGAVLRVVTAKVFDAVLPPLLVAVTITL